MTVVVTEALLFAVTGSAVICVLVTELVTVPEAAVTVARIVMTVDVPGESAPTL